MSNLISKIQMEYIYELTWTGKLKKVPVLEHTKMGNNTVVLLENIGVIVFNKSYIEKSNSKFFLTIQSLKAYFKNVNQGNEIRKKIEEYKDTIKTLEFELHNLDHQSEQVKKFIDDETELIKNKFIQNALR